jgi:hypothetical protein
LAQVYDGTTSASDFERSYKIQALVHGWDDAKTLANIPTFLSSKGLREYNKLTSKNTLKEVFDGLKKGCALSPDIAINMFYEIKRKPGESVSKFAQELQDMLKIALPGIDETLQMYYA